MALPEEQLAQNKEFVNSLTSEYREKMNELADKYYTKEYFDRIGGPRAVIEKEFPSAAFAEFYGGILSPIRSANLVYEQGEPWDRDRDIIMGLGKQIRDEVKHANILTNVVRQLGRDFDLATWRPEYYGEMTDNVHKIVKWDEPQYVAAAHQCSVEIVAVRKHRNIATYIEDEFPHVAESLEDIASDEGDHVHVGRLIINRFASPDEYEKLHDIAETKYQAMGQKFDAQCRTHSDE